MRRPGEQIAGAILLALILTAIPACEVRRDSNTRGEGVADSRPTAARDKTREERDGKNSPNVVVVMTDDQRAESLRAMPNVKRKLIRRGTTFRNFFATFPLCCPSRASFLTGQYAHNHGVMSNRAPDGGYEGFDDEGSLPVSLQRAGYRTGWIGKYMNGYGKEGRGSDGREVPRGWDRWYAPVDGTHLMFDYEMNENGRMRSYGDKRRHYQTDVLASKAERFIRYSARRSAPFFLVVSTLAPHNEPPWVGAKRNPRPAPRHEDRFQHRRLRKPPSFDERDVSSKPQYVRERSRLDRRERRTLRRLDRDRLASLLAVDDAVGAIVRKLRREGELRDTLILYTTDHGYLLGEHRLKGKPHLYDEVARFPLIARGPGFPKGERRERLVANIDLAPTVIDVAGAEPGRNMDGRSLAPTAKDPSLGRRRAILLQSKQGRAVRTRRFMYAEYSDGGRELYDMRSDRFQLNNKHEDPLLRSTRRRLVRKLHRLEDCAGRRECR